MSILIVIINEHDSCDMSQVIAGMPIVESLSIPYSILTFSFGSGRQPLFPQNSDPHVTTFSYPERLSYGEQIKIAFQFAIEQQLAAVAILDGELRYPMQELPGLIQVLNKKKADLVLAVPSRGNDNLALAVEARILTIIINLLTQGHLKAWHPGFRVYRVDALRNIPFEKNSSDRTFNAEILLQFVIQKKNIQQVCVKPYPALDISFFEKMKLANNIILAAIYSIFHRYSILYQPQFDFINPVTAYQLKLDYRSSHTVAAGVIPAHSRVLDIGCGNGDFDRFLAKLGHQVHGIDQHETRFIDELDEYTCIDLDVKKHKFKVHGYNVILILDVLEHLRYPDALLEYVRKKCGAQPKPLLLVSVPNVAFFVLRLRLLFGSFHYGKFGILDLTHTRLYTRTSIVSLIEHNGFTVKDVIGIPAPYPKAFGLNVASRFLLWCNQLLIKLSSSLFAYQFLIVCKPQPLLSDLELPSKPEVDTKDCAVR